MVSVLAGLEKTKNKKLKIMKIKNNKKKKLILLTQKTHKVNLLNVFFLNLITDVQ